VVFLDYQNVYRGARDAFHPPLSPSQHGQIDPVGLGELITRRSRFDRSLAEVRVYRGQPDAARDPKGYAAWSRQVESWRRDPRVVVISRTLRYPPNWPRGKPQEKGIDVALAVDLVLMAVRHEYDVGIVMSTDTDLKPALEAVVDLGGNPYPKCEVAAWFAEIGASRRLSLPRRRVWCHWLTAETTGPSLIRATTDGGRGERCVEAMSASLPAATSDGKPRTTPRRRRLRSSRRAPC
jgi:hypothetical protein